MIVIQLTIFVATFRFLISQVGGLWATVAMTAVSILYTVVKKDLWGDWSWLR